MNLKISASEEKPELAPSRVTVCPIYRTCSPNSVPDGGLDPLAFFGHPPTDAYSRSFPAHDARARSWSCVGPWFPHRLSLQIRESGCQQPPSHNRVFKGYARIRSLPCPQGDGDKGSSDVNVQAKISHRSPHSILSGPFLIRHKAGPKSVPVLFNPPPSRWLCPFILAVEARESWGT